MVRMITSFIIVSLLTLNMAWAVDECAFSDPLDSGTGLTQTLDSTPADSTGTLPACNYWCAGWTSFVTLPGSSVLLSSLLPTFEGGINTASYFFPTASPPTHPPSI